jgi:hypothetical protein
MNDTIIYKTCSKCNIEKPANNDFYHKERKGKYNLRSVCKVCRREGRKWKWEIVLETNEKKCPSCKIVKHISQFGVDNTSKDGVYCYCLECVKHKCSDYRINNLQTKRKSALNYSRSDKNKERVKQLYIKNPKICRIKDCYNTIAFEKRKSFYCSENCKLTSIKLQNERRKNKHKEKLKTDKFYKLKTDVRRRVFMAIQKYLNSNKTILGKNTLQIIGCSWEELKQHLENQFQKGMTWDNHGIKGWHIDHHIPLATAETEQDVYRLNHYTNLKPLWWYENLSKGDKISKEWGNA